jgi:hypothetical protein
MVIRAENAAAGQGRPEATIWRILAALKGQVIQEALPLRASDAGEEIPPCGEMMLHH